MFPVAAALRGGVISVCLRRVSRRCWPRACCAVNPPDETAGDGSRGLETANDLEKFPILAGPFAGKAVHGFGTIASVWSCVRLGGERAGPFLEAKAIEEVALPQCSVDVHAIRLRRLHKAFEIDVAGEVRLAGWASGGSKAWLRMACSVSP